MAKAVKLDPRRPKNGQGPAGVRWWLVDRKAPTMVAGAVFGWLDRLHTRTRGENFRDLLWEAIYTGRPMGSDVEVGSRALLTNPSSPARLNVTESVIDTLASKTAKRRPMPVVSADNAGYTEKLFARRASRVLRRKLGGDDLEQLRPRVLKDALVRGTGASFVYAECGDVKVERVPRYQCVVDPREARFGTPRTLMRVNSIAKDVLIESFPKFAEQINHCAATRIDDWQPFDYDSPADSDLIEVAQAWRLGAGDKPGRWVTAIRGTVLQDVEWTRKRFPIVFTRYKHMPRGMWGKGLTEILAGLQAFIDGEFKDIQEAFYWSSALVTFVPRGANIIKEHLRARHPAIVETDGATPTYVAPNPVSVQRLNFFFQLVEKMYEIAGISQLSASSKNPLGSNASGKAIDTMYDIESDRFAELELEYARDAVEIGRVMLDEARAIVERGDEKPAAWIREIGDAKKWAKFDIDGGDYHLVMEAENFVPDSRGGRLSTIGEFGKSGLVTDKAKLLSLFDEPDMRRLFRSELAPYDAMCSVLEQVGDPDVDLPYVDPQFAPYDQLIVETKNEYLAAKSEQNVPEEVLQRYRDFLQLVIAEQQAAAPPTPAPSPLGQMTPQPQPGPVGPMGPMGLAAPPTLNPIMPQGVA